MQFGYTDNFLAPATGYAIVGSGKAEIHIDVVSEEVVNASADAYTVFDMDALRNALGVTTMTWHSAYHTRVAITTKNNQSLSYLYGRSGFKVTPDGKIGRSYSSDLSVVGAYATSQAEIFDIGNLYHIDILASVT